MTKLDAVTVLHFVLCSQFVRIVGTLRKYFLSWNDINSKTATDSMETTNTRENDNVLVFFLINKFMVNQRYLGYVLYHKCCLGNTWVLKFQISDQI